jgi:hypothetical protein
MDKWVWALLVGAIMIAVGFGIVKGFKFKGAEAELLPHKVGGITMTALGLAAFVVGLLGIVGVLGRPATTTSATPSVSPPATPTTASESSSTTPTTESGSPSPSDTPTHTPTGSVEILSPKPGAGVGKCQEFTGTADLSTNKTLVLAAINESNHSGIYYFEPVHNWDDPEALSSWEGTQFFGTDDPGQRYTVRVLSLDVQAVRAAMSDPKKRQVWSSASLPGGSETKARIGLIRRSGAGSC